MRFPGNWSCFFVFVLFCCRSKRSRTTEFCRLEALFQRGYLQVNGTFSSRKLVNQQNVSQRQAHRSNDVKRLSHWPGSRGIRKLRGEASTGVRFLTSSSYSVWQWCVFFYLELFQIGSPNFSPRQGCTSLGDQAHTRQLKGCLMSNSLWLRLLCGSVGWAADFSSGHDPQLCGFEPRIGLCADSSEPGACFKFGVSLSLCPSLLTLCLSQK